MKREYCIKITTLLVFLVVFLPGVAAAQEASLYFSPSSGTFTAGTTFPVAVRVNTSGSAINAAQGILVFDPKKFTVVSTSKTNSIFALWTQEPTFSNSAGTLEFGGGVPSPGFSGAAGTIFTITFRARTAGDGTVTFSSGSILANDGRGTNILSFLGSGTYTIIPSTLPLPPEEGSLKPSLPNVSSLTHPSQDAWYSNNAPEFV
ncbi:MAG: cohesin domain-containing protein, partial [Candidatus Pacearchaeota archaeon]|nr:cohesin domain-containing protein [Candidatus Pacearchaeota archaeon]